MKTIAEQLIQLNQIKSDMRQAIISKGVQVAETDGLAVYASKIAAINAIIPAIEFTIKIGLTTTTCQAQEGMTWREWRNSDYNTVGLWIYSDSIHQDPVIVKKDGNSPSFIENSSSTLVKASDIIIEGEQYDDDAYAWEGSNPVWE